VTAAPEIAISQEDFATFRDFFRRRTGIYFEDTKRYFVDRRLEGRILATAHTTCRQYLSFVQFQASQLEFQKLVNVMTVNETYFYREDYQLKTLVDEVMDEVLRRKGRDRPLRIWSMPCSTGEEPYSIGIYLLENWPKIHEVDVEIVGSDINSEVVAACQRGVYTAYALRAMSPQLIQKYFTRLADGNFSISDDLRGAIRFTVTNVADPDQTRAFRDYDIVFCRNLLIYFDDVTRREAVENLYGVLNPGGYLFLGHSESMSRISSLFNVASASSFLCYQKPV
jgi:chemotaxis protein methyltransferase CheR